MKNVKAGLVLTTINKPTLLEGYYENAKRWGHLDDIKVYVIPDKKTPSEVYELCDDLVGKGLSCKCPSIKEQELFLKKLGNFGEIVPYGSDNRRNVGFLMALEDGVDYMVSIDDDNHISGESDFFGEHSIVEKKNKITKKVKSKSGWYNIVEMLELDNKSKIYPRGFPVSERHETENLKFEKESSNIMVNQGLWLSDPDIDAITWLVAPSQVLSLESDSMVLGPKTWSPVNTQNTSLHRKAISCYYFIPMNYNFSGYSIDRYGDIFSGYFLQKVVKHFGHGIRFGTPMVDHLRNHHNYMKDAEREFGCLKLLDDVLEMLKSIDISGSTYPEAYVSLSHEIEDNVEEMEGEIWTDPVKGYFHRVAHHMRRWIDAVRIIEGKK